MFVKYLLGITLFVIAFKSGYSKVCNVNDEACFTRSAFRSYLTVVKGEKGFESLDPIREDLMRFSVNNVDYILYNVSMEGFDDCVLEAVQFPIKTDLYYDLLCPGFTLKADYTMKGNVLGYDIEGDGNCTILTNSQQIRMNYALYMDKSTDKTYLKVVEHNFFLNSDGGVIHNYERMKNSHPGLDDKLHEVLHNNWKILSLDIQRALMDKFAAKITENSNQYLSVVPLEELFTNK